METYHYYVQIANHVVQFAFFHWILRVVFPCYRFRFFFYQINLMVELCALALDLIRLSVAQQLSSWNQLPCKKMLIIIHNFICWFSSKSHKMLFSLFGFFDAMLFGIDFGFAYEYYITFHCCHVEYEEMLSKPMVDSK